LGYKNNVIETDTQVKKNKEKYVETV